MTVPIGDPANVTIHPYVCSGSSTPYRYFFLAPSLHPYTDTDISPSPSTPLTEPASDASVDRLIIRLHSARFLSPE